ncbi:hypothetical protein H632_c2201p0, partial [Helicosporidium sp. ATCC 50920]
MPAALPTRTFGVLSGSGTERSRGRSEGSDPVLALNQQNALLLLKGSIDATNKLDWSTAVPTCQWTGITCNAAGEVTAINVPNMGLTGQLPLDADLWQQLSTVTNLNLSNNNISGYVPQQMAALSNVQYISLAGNSFSGPLPSSWSSMHNLVGLDLSNNAISGTLPSAWSNMSALKELDLSHNSLSGTVPASWNALSLNGLSLAANSA